MPESALDDEKTLYDVPALSTRETAEIADALMIYLAKVGWEELQVNQRVQLRLLRTLLDGFADE